MKKSSFFLILIPLLIVLFFSFWLRAMSAPVDMSCTDSSCRKTFIIPKNQGLSTISLRLKGEGLIKNSLVFKLLVLKRGLSTSIQAGSFYLKPSMTAEEILESLISGREDVWITFPEGWRREQYADRLKANFEDFKEDLFLELTKNKEGFLFPDTYLFPKDILAEKAVEVIALNFDKKWKILGEDASKSNFSQFEILTLASIIEREAKEEDRKLIAGILIKRLENSWPLQVDATLQFVKAELLCKKDPACNWWPKVSRADLKVNSPYNTYENQGLPVGPICSPGASSIKAVLFPEESKYWFYLTGNDGKMYYARTAEEHSKNISLYLR
ncbi:endolytic transglycosylase MltG [Patescibacteria group bacterium]|nr:endolytic transglycosylase MltG [Patescibacteria group bacterium]